MSWCACTAGHIQYVVIVFVCQSAKVSKQLLKSKHQKWHGLLAVQVLCLALSIYLLTCLCYQSEWQKTELQGKESSLLYLHVHVSTSAILINLRPELPCEQYVQQGYVISCISLYVCNN